MLECRWSKSSPGLIQSEWEVYLTGMEIQIWRKELVYISMVLFILAAVLHLCIRIFLVIKLGRREFLTKTSILILTLVGGFSGLIMFYTGMVSHIKDQFHPAIALLFNMLGVSLLGYLLVSNSDAVELVKKKIKIHKLVSSSLEKRQSDHLHSFALNKDRRRTFTNDSDREMLHVERSDDFLQGDTDKDTTWVGIVKIVDLDQHRGRAVFFNKLS
jgi:hypothetical protein